MYPAESSIQALPRRSRRFSLLLTSLCLTLFSFVANAQQTEASRDFDASAAATELDQLQEIFNDEYVDTQLLDTTRNRALSIRSDATTCVTAVKPEAERLQSELELLGDISDNVDVEIWESRNQTLEKYNRLIAVQTGCDLVIARANRIIASVEERFKAISAELLSTRSYNLVTIVKESPEEILRWSTALSAGIVPRFSEGTDPLLAIWGVLFALGIGTACGWYLRKQYRVNTLATAKAESAYTDTLYFLTPFFKRVPLILAGFAMTSALMSISETPYYESLPIRFALGVMVYGFGLFLVDWCTGQSSPVGRVSKSAQEQLQPLRRKLRYLVFALIASIVVLGPFWLGTEASDKFKLLRLIAVVGTVVPLYMILVTASKYSWLSGRFRAMRTVAFVVLTVTVLAEIFGYHNFCNFMLRGFILSTLALFLLWVLLWQTSVFIEWLNNSEQPLAKFARAALGFSDEKRRPGVGLYQLIVDTSVWISFIIALIYIWDNSHTIINKLMTQATEGVVVGNITIVPADIIAGIAIFVAIMVITGWIKRWMERRWLEHITRDRGTRDAATTVVGYIGFMLAAIVALSMAGVNITGLAVIAGALSVGIGFGLQAIVNNFVSGIILLFERPIKAGDFVSVGETEGFVKRISIRSTEIETLDNQDVLVPNSELISGRVTNWVLHNPYGRLRIQVGVAYGSDTDQVRRILEEAAMDHPEVITDGRAAGPKALFMGFGDSALEFELRVRILRIPKRFDVTSEINFEIDRRFREAGIQIPFPQRDLHIKEWPGERPDKPASDDVPDEDTPKD